MAMLPSLLKNRSPRSGDGNGKSTVGGSQKRRNAAQPTSVTRLFKGFGTLPNKQKQRFPAPPEIAVSSLCGNKDTACQVYTEFGINLASRAFVYTNAQNGLPALPPEVRFCSLGQRPKPFEQPLAGAGYVLGNRTLTKRKHLQNCFFLNLWDYWKTMSSQPYSNFRS